MNDKKMLSHQEVTDLLPGYALSALDDGEARLVAQHLATCPICRLELAELQEMVSLLAFAAPPARPSPDAKSALFARVKSSQRPAPQWDRALEDTLPGRPKLEDTQPAGRNGARPGERVAPTATIARRPTPIFGGRARSALAALAAVLVLALGGWNWTLRGQLQEERQRTELLRSQPPEERLVARLLNNPQAARALTPVTDPASSRTVGFIYTDPESNVALVITYAMPTLQPNQRYQIWLRTGNERDSGGLFTVDARGYGQLLIRAPAPLSKYQTVGITAEPYDGSSGPTSTAVVGGSIQ